MRLRHAFPVLCGLLLSAGPAHAAETPEIDGATVEGARGAFAAAERGDWAAAYALLIDAPDPIGLKVLRWLDYRRDESPASFADLTRFMEANPAWPGLATLRRQAERRIEAGATAPTILAWFEKAPSVTAEGGLAHAGALQRAGRAEEAAALARTVWRERDFQTVPDESRFAAQFTEALGPADHAARLDRLLWSDSAVPAQRMLAFVDPGTRALAEARLALAKQDAAAEAAVARVPAALRDHAGLKFEQVRWLRRKNRDEDALARLSAGPKETTRAERWFAERHPLARRFIARREFAKAYKAIAGHAVASGGDFAEGEFLAGWLALTKLNDAPAAYAHFGRLYAGVSLPISVGRAAYWAGRAALALGKTREAEEWYRSAARQPTTYFGQLALAQLRKPLPVVTPAPQAAGAARAAFDADELVRAARLLSAAGQIDKTAPFLFELGRRAQNSNERVLAAELSVEVKRPRQAIAIAKRSLGAADYLVAYDFPVIPLPEGVEGEPSLVLATTRQESGFETDALSSAGARGLMQLMPGTAREMAAAIGVAYEGEAMLADGAVNLRLGSAYLARMLERFAGSRTLALAAYNAGPSRVAEWLTTYGDPRTDAIDDTDWIESLPLAETRNYVQRVLEAVPFYRRLLGEDTQFANAEAPPAR